MDPTKLEAPGESDNNRGRAPAKDPPHRRRISVDKTTASPAAHFVRHQAHNHKGRAAPFKTISPAKTVVVRTPACHMWKLTQVLRHQPGTATKRMGFIFVFPTVVSSA
jgi:hypothetical protein